MTINLPWFLLSSVTILAVLGVRALVRNHVSKRLLYAVWLIVALRLLLPTTLFASPMSLMNLWNERPVEPDAPMPATPMINEIVPAVITPPASIDVQTTISDPPVMITAIAWDEVFMAVHWIGAALLFAFFVVCYGIFYGKLLRSRKFSQQYKRLSVYRTSAVNTPCLFGFCIYLPNGMFEDAARQEHVLTHEHTHFVHGDMVWSLIRIMCLCLHWYNPLVWAAALLSKHDSELACDEGSLARLGMENKNAYGMTLIALLHTDRKRNILVNAMGASKKFVKSRILAIAEGRKKSALVAAALIVACAALIGCTFTGSTDPTTNELESTARNVVIEIESIGAYTIEITDAGSTDGASHADGSPFAKGEVIGFSPVASAFTISAYGADDKLLATQRVEDAPIICTLVLTESGFVDKEDLAQPEKTPQQQSAQANAPVMPSPTPAPTQTPEDPVVIHTQIANTFFEQIWNSFHALEAADLASIPGAGQTPTNALYANWTRYRLAYIENSEPKAALMASPTANVTLISPTVMLGLGIENAEEIVSYSASISLSYERFDGQTNGFLATGRLTFAKVDGNWLLTDFFPQAGHPYDYDTMYQTFMDQAALSGSLSGSSAEKIVDDCIDYYLSTLE